MPTAKEYRQRAEECLRLARSAGELYVKIALAELAQEFHHTADDLEARVVNRDDVAPRSSRLRTRSRPLASVASRPQPSRH
jgi:hypothetical protein